MRVDSVALLIWWLTPAVRLLVSCTVCAFIHQGRYTITDIALAACWLVSLLRTFLNKERKLGTCFVPGFLIEPFPVRTYMHNQTSKILLSNHT